MLGTAVHALATGKRTSSSSSGLCQQSAKSVPAMSFLSISISYIGAMLTSNLALSYLSYPLQSLMKSCKIVPVMLMRMIVNKKRYRLIEYAQVVCVTAGIAVFMLNDGKSAKHQTKQHAADEWQRWCIGVALCCLSLVMDGFTGPTQEKINSEYKPTMSCMMLSMNAWAIGLVTMGLVATGQLQSGLAFVREYPSILQEAALFSLLSALGQACILLTLRRFDSLILVTITTTRKFFTILGSVMAFGHQLKSMQWVGVALVFAGLGVEILDKYGRKQRQMQQHKHTQGKTQ